MANRASLSQIKKIAAMRAAGRTLADIANKTNLSVRTVGRIVAKFDIEKRDFYREHVELARRELFDDANDAAEIQQEIASLVRDDISKSKRLRELITRTADSIETLLEDMQDIEDVSQAARAIAALSTSLKAASDVRSRVTMNAPAEELRPLPIMTMTDDEVDEQRRRLEAGDEIDLINEIEIVST